MNVFRIVVVLVGLVPLFLGGTGVLFGAAEHAGGEAVAAALDSQYRYLAAVYIAVGAMIIYSVLGPPAVVREKRYLLRFAMLGWFLGGLARGVSWLSVGEPASWQISGMVIELVVPVVLLVWQARVVKR